MTRVTAVAQEQSSRQRQDDVCESVLWAKEFLDIVGHIIRAVPHRYHILAARTRTGITPEGIRDFVGVRLRRP